MSDDLIYGEWDTDEDEVPASEHNPNCHCDECDPLTDETDPDEDIDNPEYHAPNMCKDPKCNYIQCQDDGAVHSERFPGEDIWWKTIDNWNNL
jgi:hypothetical protein